MPQYKAVWHGRRLVSAETVITAATAEEARAIAEQMDRAQLHFRVVDDAYDQIADLTLHSLEPDDGEGEEKLTPEDEQADLAAGEDWRPSL